MKMIKCDRGHFYDGDEYSQCPYCDPGDPGRAFVPVREEPRREFCVLCGRRLKPGSSVCSFCGQDQAEDPYPDRDERGRKGKWMEDTFHCHKCRKTYESKEDKYCRYCGEKRTNEITRYFSVSPDYVELLYGPMPATLYYHCGQCGNQWEGSNWDRQGYCPQCGARVFGFEEKSYSMPFSMTETEDEDAERTIRIDFSLTINGKRINIPKDGCVIGRRASGAELLRDRSVSRKHFSIKPLSETTVEIVDMSSYGTKVNGKTLKKGEAVKIEVGAVIGAGNCLMRLERR